MSARVHNVDGEANSQIKTGPGELRGVVFTVGNSSDQIICYDNASETASGTIVFRHKGAVVATQLPNPQFKLGLYVVQTGATAYSCIYI